jgi:hypothetical protein
MGCGSTHQPQVTPITVQIQSIPSEKPLTDEDKLAALPSGYVRIYGDKYQFYIVSVNVCVFFNVFLSLKISNEIDSYSSPLLVINLYKDTNITSQSGTISGLIHVNTKTEQKEPNKQTASIERYIACTEEQLIVPVEDVIHIKFTSHFRKSTIHVETKNTVKEAKYEGKIFSKRKEVDIVQTETEDKKDAKRFVTIEIKYFK